MAIQQICYNRSCNLIQYRPLCQSANVFNNDLQWLIPVKMCINFGISLHNTPFKKFTDTSSQAALMFLNLLTPNVNYSGRTAPLTRKVAFYIFIQQIQVLNI